MEMERIDVKNLKELDKRTVVCTYLPTYSLNTQWMLAFTQVILSDFDCLNEFVSYDKHSYENTYHYQNIDLKKEIPSIFDNEQLKTLEQGVISLLGYSRQLDCTICLEFFEKNNKIHLSSHDDYIVNRFLLGGAQKKRGTHLFNLYMDQMELMGTAYLAMHQEKMIKQVMPVLKKMK